MATERRVRTKWVLRQRYARAADVATMVGAVVGIAVVAAIWPSDPGAWMGRRFVIGAFLIVLALTLGPRLLIKAAWRMMHWRHYEEWG